MDLDRISKSSEAKTNTDSVDVEIEEERPDLIWNGKRV